MSETEELEHLLGKMLERLEGFREASEIAPSADLHATMLVLSETTAKLLVLTRKQLEQPDWYRSALNMAVLRNMPIGSGS
jgi:hypothetical protein